MSHAPAETHRRLENGPRLILVGPEPLTELVTWRDAIDDKPDAEISVAIWFTAPDGTADWERGWWDGQAWRLCESGGVVDGVVLHWAQLEGPQ